MKYTAIQLKKMNIETLEKCVRDLNIIIAENFDEMQSPQNPKLLYARTWSVRNELQAQLNINNRK